MKTKVQLKMSAVQYQKLLQRIGDRQGPQQSVLNQMPDLSQIGQGVPGIAGQAPMGVPPTLEMQTPAMPPESAFEPQGVPGIQSIQSPMGNALTTAQNVWDEIKDGVGGRLWERVAAGIPQRGNQKPEDLFFQEFVKYQQDPNSVDPRAKNFLATLQQSSPAAQMPQTPEQDPMHQAIMQAMVGGMPNG